MPYLKINNSKDNTTLKILIDSGANKNVIRPGILAKTKKIKPTLTKNFCGSKIISSKGKATLLGPNFPAVSVYELNFHKFFDGLIGSETLSKLNAAIDYNDCTLTLLDQTIPFKKYYISHRTKIGKQYNHIITLPSDQNGDWIVTKPTTLINNIIIEPGVYRSKNKTTTIIVRTKSLETPKIPTKLSLEVNNFECHDFFSPSSTKSEKIPIKTIESLIRTNHLSEYEKIRTLETLSKHDSVILKDNEKLTATSKIKHKINTRDETPIHTKTYRYPHALKSTVREQIQDMLENGIISHSESPWNAPIWVVPKKSDASGKKKYRVVIDYRKLNDKTIDDRHPIPQIEDILDNLGRSSYFTTLDLKSGFHQIELDKDSRQKTAFSTDLGHFEFLRMPFGLKNAPATFQRAMNSILGDLIGTIC